MNEPTTTHAQKLRQSVCDCSKEVQVVEKADFSSLNTIAILSSYCKETLPQ